MPVRGGELPLGEELFFLARPALGDVQGGPDAKVGEVPVERQLHVAGALELLEDHLIHPAARVDEARGDDREAAAVLDLAGGAEELLGDF